MRYRPTPPSAHGHEDLHFVLTRRQTFEALGDDVIGRDRRGDERGEIDLAGAHQVDRLGVVVGVADARPEHAVLHHQLSGGAPSGVKSATQLRNPHDECEQRRKRPHRQGWSPASAHRRQQRSGQARGDGRPDEDGARKQGEQTRVETQTQQNPDREDGHREQTRRGGRQTQRYPNLPEDRPDRGDPDAQVDAEEDESDPEDEQCPFPARLPGGFSHLGGGRRLAAGNG